MLKLVLLLLVWFLPLALFVWYVWWEHKTKSSRARQPHPSEERIYAQYREFLNDRVGFFSFTFALAALGTDSPQFYALLSLGFVLIIWAIRAYDFRRVVKLWSEEKSWRLSIWSIVRQFPVFMFGYLSLLAILFGWLEKGTFKSEISSAVTKILGFL